MYSFYREIHAPTGVDHCVKCNFYSHAEKNLVIACSSYLRVYRLTETVRAQNTLYQIAYCYSYHLISLCAFHFNNAVCFNWDQKV